MKSEVIYIRGRFCEAGEATVPLLDAGYLLGAGVFATMHAYDGACFRPERHLAEIARGAEMFGVAPPAELARAAELADEAARRTGARDAYVRVTLTAGAPGGAPILSIIARPLDAPAPELYERGARVVTVGPRRLPPACVDGTVKTTSYGPQVIVRREVARAGADEGIQLAVGGELACGTMSNLFLVAGERLLTPSLESGCRAGITRGAILEIAERVGLAPREEVLAPLSLFEADEAFLTSSRVECLPIATVDGRAVGRAEGPRFARTRALREALGALVRSETARRREAAR